MSPNETEQSLASAFDGAAPGAKLVVTDLGNGDEELENARFFDEIFPHAHRAGARLHSLSITWGGPGGDSMAMLTDDFHVDHPDFLLLAAAGNDGVAGSIHSPAKGKNVVAVGATENTRESWAAFGTPQMVMETLFGDQLALVISDAGVRIFEELPSLFVLVEASPADACSTFVGDHYNQSAVLVKIGACSVKTKVLNAIQAGAVAIFLYDDTPGDAGGSQGAESMPKKNRDFENAVVGIVRAVVEEPNPKKKCEAGGRKVLEEIAKISGDQTCGKECSKAIADSINVAAIVAIVVPRIIEGVAVAAIALEVASILIFPVAIKTCMDFDDALTELISSIIDLCIINVQNEWREFQRKSKAMDAELDAQRREALGDKYSLYDPWTYRRADHRRRSLLETPPSPHFSQPNTLPWMTPDPPLEIPTLSQIVRILNSTAGTNMTLVRVRPATSADSLLNGVDVLADFSSRGPARGHRIKPDVLCPGHKIVTVKSDGNTLTNQVRGFALASTPLVCLREKLPHAPLDDHSLAGFWCDPLWGAII